MAIAETAERTSDSIERGAGEIREIVSQFVTELAGSFPRNSMYKQGDVNRIYCIPGADIWPPEVQCTTLDPDGQFRSGKVAVNFSKESCHFTLEISQADQRGSFEPASSLEVLTDSFELVGKLFYQIVEELPKQSDIATIGKWLGALSRQEELEAAIFIRSKKAFKEAGWTEWRYRKVFRNEGMKETKRMIAAFEIYEKKDQLIADVSVLSRGGKAEPVQSWFESFVSLMKKKQLMPPADVKHPDWGAWLVLGLSQHYPDQVKYGAYPVGYQQLRWGVSTEGKVREVVTGIGLSPGSWEGMYVSDCPEHLLKQAPEITDQLIRRMMVNIFPQI